MSETVWSRVSSSSFFIFKIAGKALESRAGRSRRCFDGKAHGDVSLKSFLGLCEETVQVTHSDCQNVNRSNNSLLKSLYTVFTVFLF